MCMPQNNAVSNAGKKFGLHAIALLREWVSWIGDLEDEYLGVDSEGL